MWGDCVWRHDGLVAEGRQGNTNTPHYPGKPSRTKKGTSKFTIDNKVVVHLAFDEKYPLWKRHVASIAWNVLPN